MNADTLHVNHVDFPYVSASGIQWEIAGGINALLLFLSTNPTNQLYNHSPPPLSASLFAFTWTLHGKHSSSAVRSHECLVPLVSGVKHFARFKLSVFCLQILPLIPDQNRKSSIGDPETSFYGNGSTQRPKQSWPFFAKFGKSNFARDRIHFGLLVDLLL